MSTKEDGRPPPLFVGDHLALDFLNTTAAPWGERIEWLGNGADLVGWLEQAGAIDDKLAARFRAERDAQRTLDAVAEQARTLRQWLRGFVERHAGRMLGAGSVEELEPLNRLLARDDSYGQIEAAAKRRSDSVQGQMQVLRWRQERRWTSPERLLQPIAQAIGDILCHADFRYIRRCEGAACTLVFYDRSKSHARRWCSMAACGNRAKAATHRAKQRQASDATQRAAAYSAPAAPRRPRSAPK